MIRFSFERLMSLLKESIQFRALIGLVDTIIAKYAATVVGFFVLSRCGPLWGVTNRVGRVHCVAWRGGI